jgi:hypothetical protein
VQRAYACPMPLISWALLAQHRMDLPGGARRSQEELGERSTAWTYILPLV